MSRWLKSVNNLLENLDGAAENVAEDVAEATTGVVGVGQLLETSRQVVGLATATAASSDDEDDYNDDEYSDDNDDDDDEEDEEEYSDNNDDEFTTDDEEHEIYEIEEVAVQEDDVGDPDHTIRGGTMDLQSGVAGMTESTHRRLKQLQPKASTKTGLDDSVSDLSFSEHGQLGIDEEAKAPRPPSAPARSGNQSRIVPSSRSPVCDSPKRDESPRQLQRFLEPTNVEGLSEPLPILDDDTTHPATAVTQTTNRSVSSSQDPDAKEPSTRTFNDKTASGRPIVGKLSSTGPAEDLPTPPAARIPVAPRSKGVSTFQSSNLNMNASAVNLSKTIQSLQAQLAKIQKELSGAETQNKKLTQQLHASETEVEAQAKELQQAGEQLAQYRTKAQEDQDDLMDEHEEELEELEKKHKTEVDGMREEYEKTIAEWKQQYELEQTKRRQEGGDWTKELEDAIQREKDAIKRLHEVTTEKMALQSKLDKITLHDSLLQEQLEAARSASKAAAEREQKAQEELDTSTNLHAKQIAQRQRREAELEQTVLELGSALTLAKQQRQPQSAGQASASIDPDFGPSSQGMQQLQQEHSVELARFKEQVDQFSEELESARVSLTMETQRREALQCQLTEISKERADEAAMAQLRQQQTDSKVTGLESTVARLQALLRANRSIAQELPQESMSRDEEGISSRHLTHELGQSKREVAKLSEQLLRHQGMVENSKSEILTLKGRLQAATARAEEAERSLFGASSNATHGNVVVGGSLDVESAIKRPQPFSMRRRVKGGVRGVRSIRSALHLGPGRGLNPALEQVAQTLDTVDAWMIDTGSLLRYEPLARFGFLVYLLTLHVWTFALVVFHTTEVPHGDFGSMDSKPQHWRTHTKINCNLKTSVLSTHPHNNNNKNQTSYRTVESNNKKNTRRFLFVFLLHFEIERPTVS